MSFGLKCKSLLSLLLTSLMILNPMLAQAKKIEFLPIDNPPSALSPLQAVEMDLVDLISYYKGMDPESRQSTLISFKRYLTSLDEQLKEADFTARDAGEYASFTVSGAVLYFGSGVVALPFKIMNEAQKILIQKIATVGLLVSGGIALSGLILFSGSIAIGAGDYVLSKAETSQIRKSINNIQTIVVALESLN